MAGDAKNVKQDGDQMHVVRTTGEDPIPQLVTSLGLEQPQAVISLIDGGGSEALSPKLSDHQISAIYPLLSSGLALAATELKALIIDSGLGVFSSMVGRGLAHREHRAPLLGVASSAMISMDNDQTLEKPGPNHTHLALVDEGVSEQHTALNLADAFFKQSDQSLGAVVMVLVHGGANAREAALRGVRKGWPLVVLAGSGGFADELVQASLSEDRSGIHTDTLDIIQEGNLCLFREGDSAERLKRLLTQLIQGDDMLKMAWRRFASFDQNAISQDKQFMGTNRLILILGVLGTLLGLISTHIPENLTGWEYTIDRLFHWTIVVTPIFISVLAAAANFFKPGTKRIAYRAAAESVKREIFMYRTGAGEYQPKKDNDRWAQHHLADRLKSISDHLMTTDVNESAIAPYEGPIPPKMDGRASVDTGLTHLSAGDYIRFRLEDQLDYYWSKTNKLNAQMRFFHWVIYIMGGMGTLIAAFGLDHWIALTTSIAAAITSFLKFRAIEETIVKFNQVATSLDNVRGWWLALSTSAQKEPANINELVSRTERIFETEISAWVSRMQDAMADAPTSQSAEDDDSAPSEKQEINQLDSLNNSDLIMDVRPKQES